MEKDTAANRTAVEFFKAVRDNYKARDQWADRQQFWGGLVQGLIGFVFITAILIMAITYVLGFPEGLAGFLAHSYAEYCIQNGVCDLVQLNSSFGLAILFYSSFSLFFVWLFKYFGSRDWFMNAEDKND